MNLEVIVIKTRKTSITLSLTCALKVGGRFSESISEDVADGLISTFGLKQSDKIPSVRLNSNEGMFDYIFS